MTDGHSRRERDARGSAGVSRRGLLAATAVSLAGAASASGWSTGPAFAQGVPRSDPRAVPSGSENSFSRDYYRLLLEHTRWSETVWDEAAGRYQGKDFNFAVVLGHAVLLTLGDYDADLAGVPRATLAARTLPTIRHFAASNKWAGGTEWGARIYWDSTFEAYFVAAAKLLWDHLDPQTHANVEAIMRGAAGYVVGPGRDENTTLAGNYRGDSKIEEMGAKSMPLAAASAHLPDDPGADTWREWLNLWTLNMGGLPVADRANTARIEGRAVADWMQGHNVYDSFAVENHGSYSPIYQESMGAYPGRNAVQFLLAGRRLPQSQVGLPNADELWATLAHLGTDAGLSAHPMVADRFHLYGRDVLPLAFRTTVLGDRYAARAERMLADHLVPYFHYPPSNRLTKFSGEPKYEPEARAELAMAYLLHYWRERLAGSVEPVGRGEFFERFAGAVDYGAEVGMVGHQTTGGLAIAVSKPGFVKFAFLPEHDDWMFDVAGTSPAFIPAVATQLTGRTVHTYRGARDGFEGSATVFGTTTGYAGFTTQADGTVVYATTGLAPDEGVLRVFNLSMPGVRGLDGDRTFHGPDGAYTLTEGSDTTRVLAWSWLNIDDRVGFVVRGSRNPLRVRATSLVLSSGPATGAGGMVVEGYPGQTAAETSRAHAAREPSGGPAHLRGSMAGGCLSLFNLSDEAMVDEALQVPYAGDEGDRALLFVGTQTTGADATAYLVSLGPAEARIEPPRFRLTHRSGGGTFPALRVEVADARLLTLAQTDDADVADDADDDALVAGAGGPSAQGPVTVTVTSEATGESKRVVVPAGQAVPVRFHGPETPVRDLARCRRTYPTSPLPDGMTDPDHAVDGDPGTSWRPGPSGRMVVDLGEVRNLDAACLAWDSSRVADVVVETSPDGFAWSPATGRPRGGTTQRVDLGGVGARYVALAVAGWHSRHARLVDLRVEGA
jgi:F5/8 type C domain